MYIVNSFASSGLQLSPLEISVTQELVQDRLPEPSLHQNYGRRFTAEGYVRQVITAVGYARHVFTAVGSML